MRLQPESVDILAIFDAEIRAGEIGAAFTFDRRHQLGRLKSLGAGPHDGKLAARRLVKYFRRALLVSRRPLKISPSGRAIGNSAMDAATSSGRTLSSSQYRYGSVTRLTRFNAARNAPWIARCRKRSDHNAVQCGRIDRKSDFRHCDRRQTSAGTRRGAGRHPGGAGHRIAPGNQRMPTRVFVSPMSRPRQIGKPKRGSFSKVSGPILVEHK